MKRSIIGAMVLGLAVSAARADIITWINAAGGNWNLGGNWDAGVPDADDDAVIGNAGTYTVTLNVAATVDTLDISNPDATFSMASQPLTLEMPAGLMNAGTVSTAGSPTITGNVTNANAMNVNAGHVLTLAGPTVTNDGSVVINPTGSNSQTDLSFSGVVSLEGTGEILMNQTVNRARLLTAAASTVTNGADHTIRGVGHLLADLTNLGTINADRNGQALDLVGNSKINHGTMTATGGGVLNINSITVDQAPGELRGASGQLVADTGGTVQLSGNATIESGTLSTPDGIILNSGINTISNVFNTGTVNIIAGSVLGVGGSSLVNDGTLTINSNSGNSQTDLTFAADSVLDGTGEVIMNLNANRARIVGGPFSQFFAHTIRGVGQITAPMTNEGAIVADRPGDNLVLVTEPKTNHGTLTATNGGLLDITGIAIDQSAGGLRGVAGQIIADNGAVRLQNSSTIQEGSLSTANGGIIRNDTGSNTLTDVSSSAMIEVDAGTTLTANGSALTNDGQIVANPTQTNSQTIFSLGSGTNLGGAGELLLNHSDNLAILSGGPSVHAATHTIRGEGEIRAEIDNDGTINADRMNDRLELIDSPKHNDGTMTATNGGLLDLQNVAITQGASGQIVADGGTVRMLGNAAVTGGTVSGVNGGTVSNQSSTNSLTDVTSDATINTMAGTILNAAGSSFHNDGAVVVNVNQANTQTDFNMDANTVLDGSGEVVLNHSLNRARLTGGPMTHESGHTIRGTGQILAPMDNLGDIIADRAAVALELLNGDMLNLGTLTATNTSTLSIGSVTITQVDDGLRGGTGQIVADGGTVSLAAGATIVGGSLNTPNASEINVDAGDILLTDVTNNGLVNVAASRILSADGAALTNHGTIVVNPTQSNSQTDLTIGAGTALAGTGEVVLNHSTNRARLTGGPMTHESGHTIRGTGQILAPMDNLGNIIADRGAVALELLNGDMLNLGTLTATNAGTLSIGGVIITQTDGGEGTDGQIVADGGTVSLASGATIVGGSLNTPNASQMTVDADNVLLTDVTNNGLVNVAASRILSADGAALTNHGTIVVNHNLSNSQTDLNLAAGTALAGTGEVVLNLFGNRARLTGGPITQGPDHTIRGTGEVHAMLTSDGIVNADRAANELDLVTSPKTNNGTFAASAGGLLDVLVNVDGTGGWTADGGTIRFNSGVQATTTGPISIVNGGLVQLTNADLTGSDLTMDDTGALSVASSITLSGDVSFAMTAEAMWSWAAGSTLALTGGDPGECVSEWANLEVGGVSATGVGFGVPILTIADGAAVSLVDLIDNGNRTGGDPESRGVTTLNIGAGARLNLNGLRLFVNGAEVFAGPFGGGMIVNANGTGDLNGDGDVTAADRLCFRECFAGQDVPVDAGCAGADIDGDGDVDCDDYELINALIGGQPGVFAPCAFDRGPLFIPALRAEKENTSAQSSTGDCGAGVAPAAGILGVLPFMLAGFRSMRPRRRARR